MPAPVIGAVNIVSEKILRGSCKEELCHGYAVACSVRIVKSEMACESARVRRVSFSGDWRKW